MKNVLIIKPHSFVDLITNSSSELFVCNTDKSEKAIKEVLEKIVKDYLAVSEYNYKVSKIWGDVFEPTLEKAKWSITHDMCRKFLDKQRELEKNRRARQDDHELKVWEEFFGDTECKLYEVPQGTPDDVLDKYEAAQYRRGSWLVEVDEPLCVFINDTLGLPISSAMYLEYGITMDKGDILISSAGDNTVPYAVWEIINEVLNASHYHLD